VILEYCERFVFQMGVNRTGDALGVVRLGGHVEAGETAVQCALREVAEEARVEAEVIQVTATFAYEADGAEFALRPMEWTSDGIAPLLVARMSPDNADLSVTFLAKCRDAPTPGAETQALVFLSPEEVQWLVSRSVSLGAFLQSGGSVAMATDLAPRLTLRAHGQLRALAQLLASGCELNAGLPGGGRGLRGRRS
jgi:ADP-ribose pyrophosphatase YjhB (NUDIX family)